MACAIVAEGSCTFAVEQTFFSYVVLPYCKQDIGPRLHTTLDEVYIVRELLFRTGSELPQFVPPTCATAVPW